MDGFEKTKEGLLVPALTGEIRAGGVFTVKHMRGSKLLSVERSPNIVVDQGMNHMLDVVCHGDAQVSPWYMGIFEGNYTPVASDTATNITGNATESTAYDEATRVEWAEDAAAAKSISNGTTEATFTINATKTIYGAFLISASGKSATTGTLLCASRFAAAKPVESGDSLLITYTLSLSSS